MEKETKELKKRILKAKSILLLTHKGPDLDAFCSMLILYKVLKENFPGKDITMKAKQYPNIKLPYMENIEIVETIEYEQEDLVIITDTAFLSMCMEKDVDTIQGTDSFMIFIDHHKSTSEKDSNEMVINDLRSSATEQVYVTLREIFGKKLNLNKEIAALIQYGIVADTGRFLYDSTTSDTLRVFAEAMDSFPINMEEFTYKNAKFPQEANSVMIEYLKTLTIKGDMAYMYLSRDVCEKGNFTKQAVNEAQGFLRDNYLRFIQGVHWGFIVKPILDTPDKWFVSFRSTKEYQDVEIIAKKLDGGGHVYSSAFKMNANSIEEVLEKTLKVIDEIVIS